MIETFKNVIIVIFAFIFVLKVFQYYYKKNLSRNLEKILRIKNDELIKNTSNYANFNKDIEFLLFMIEFKISNVQKMIIEPMALTHQKSLITDSVINEHITEITTSVLNTINENYKKNLYKYFTEDSLTEFITEVVFQAITTSVIDINGRKIKGIYLK